MINRLNQLDTVGYFCECPNCGSSFINISDPESHEIPLNVLKKWNQLDQLPRTKQLCESCLNIENRDMRIENLLDK